jgi:tRNA(fMet)-specific endonuclease VapC
MSRRFLLDSNAVSDLAYHRFGVRERADEARLSGAILGTCPPVIGEIHFGLELSTTIERQRQPIEVVLHSIRHWPYENDAAKRYGRLKAALRKAGRPMQEVDIQLAAVALTLGDCTVVSTDTDLLAIPGLQVENWRNS